MDFSLVTTKELEAFQVNLLKEIEKLLQVKKNENEVKNEAQDKWLKSHQVQRLLGISPGTLQNLRINGTLPYSKMGGVILYSMKEINMVIDHNKRNHITYRRKNESIK